MGDSTQYTLGARYLTTGRTFQIKDNDATNAGPTSSAFNGTANIIMNLPSTIKASLTGNASTATKATQDSDGNQINTTYVKKSALLDLVYPVGAIYISVVNTSPETLFGGTWTQIKDTFLLSAGTNHTAGTTGGSETVTLTTAEMPAHTHAGPSHTHTGPSHTHDMQSHTHNLSSHYHWVGPQNGTANWVGLTGAAWNFVGQSTGAMPGTAPEGIIHGGRGGASYAASSKTQAANDTDGFSIDASHSHSVSTNAVNSGGPSNNTSGGPSNNTTTASGTGATGASGTGDTSSTGSGGAHNNMPPYLTVYMWKRTA